MAYEWNLFSTVLKMLGFELAVLNIRFLLPHIWLFSYNGSPI
jgi:hypothetical protein